MNLQKKGKEKKKKDEEKERRMALSLGYFAHSVRQTRQKRGTGSWKKKRGVEQNRDPVTFNDGNFWWNQSENNVRCDNTEFK